MTSHAHHDFDDQMSLVGQLVSIHGKLQQGPGRRHEQNALHHAGVVMTVAAWQSYVERIVMEAVDAVDPSALATSGPAPMPQWTKSAFALRRTGVAALVKKFNTPSAKNTRDLMEAGLAFNPMPYWTWLVGPRQWDEYEMRSRLDHWVLIRHSVAHGFSLPAEIKWLRGPTGTPRLSFPLLRECKTFFERIAIQTDQAFSQHLATTHGMTAPW